MKHTHGIALFIIAAGLMAACKHDSTGSARTVAGSWHFSIVTTSGGGENTLAFTAESASNDSAGVFTDVNAHGGPWHVSRFAEGDSIYWEYTTGATLPPGLINRIRGQLNAGYDHISGSSAGVFNGTAFTGTWEGVKSH